MTSTEKVTRGAVRLLHSLGYAAVCELPLTNGRRADVVGVGKAGEVAIVEVKSGLSDFRSDKKWKEYLPYSDAFYFAVDEAFPLSVLEEKESLPEITGIIVSDGFDGEIIRPAAPQKVHSSRRKTLHLKMARIAATRLSQPFLNCKT